MRHLLAYALAACLLSSCRPNETFAPTPNATPYSQLTPTPSGLFSPPPTNLPLGPRIVIYSASLSLSVEDPSKAMSQIEGAVLEMGGVVVSSSSWSSPGSATSSSLSARVPPDSLPTLRRIAIGLSAQVQSDGTYSQDVTADHRRLHKQLQTLALAENDLVQLLTHAADNQTAASLLIAHQMLVQERSNVEAQLADYEDRAALASFDVSFNGPAVMLVE